MSRIPLIPLETGPIIGPALQAANTIREGRARAALSEEMARTYPQENKTRMSILEEQAKREPILTQAAQQNMEIAGKQEARSAESQKYDVAAKQVGLTSAVFSKTGTAGEYNRAHAWLGEQGIPEPFLGDQLDANMSPEKVREHIENVVMPALGKASDDLQIKREEMATQKAVARIYADARASNKTDPEDLKAADKRIIYQNLYKEYQDENFEQYETGEFDLNDNPKVARRLRADAPPFDKEWKEKRFKEDLELLGNETENKPPVKDWRGFVAPAPAPSATRKSIGTEPRGYY